MAEGIRLLPNTTSYETNYDVVLCEFVLSEEKVFQIGKIRVTALSFWNNNL